MLSALRGLVLGGKLETGVAETARQEHDAAYLALAEGLDAPLYTCDAGLAAGGHDAQVQVVATSR